MLIHENDIFITKDEAVRLNANTQEVKPIEHNGQYVYSITELLNKKKIEPHTLTNVEVQLTIGMLAKIIEFAQHLKLSIHETIRDTILTGIIYKERHIDDAHKLDQ